MSVAAQNPADFVNSSIDSLSIASGVNLVTNAFMKQSVYVDPGVSSAVSAGLTMGVEFSKTEYSAKKALDSITNSYDVQGVPNGGNVQVNGQLIQGPPSLSDHLADLLNPGNHLEAVKTGKNIAPARYKK